MAADFNAGVLTDKGKALLAKWHEGSCVPELTRAAAGAGTYTSGEDLSGRTALKDERMSIGFSHIETQNETTVALRFTLTNEELTEGFTITEIGVFATDPDEGEILYSIATTADESTADYMPAYNGEYPTTIIFNYQIEVANASSVTIVAGSTGMYALAADLEAAEVKIENLETATADLEDQIEDAVKELEEDIVVKVDEAKEAADKAQATADQAVSDAATAQSTAESAQSTADQAVTDAANAQSTADSASTAAATAQSTAESAQSTADQAVSNAATAQATADQAVTDAANAQSTADQAEKDAQAAQSTADSATTAAATAQSTAESAQSAADQASTAAATAQSAADKAQETADQAVTDAATAQSTADSAKSGLADGSVTKVGTSTVGGSAKPIYLDGGTPTACSLYPTSTFSLSTGSWSSSVSGDYNYRYQLSVSGVTADTIALAFLDTSCASVAGDAGMCSVVESSSGTLTFRAVDIPTADITGSVVLLNS